MDNKSNNKLKYLNSDSKLEIEKNLEKLVSELKDKQAFDDSMKSTWNDFVEGNQDINKDLTQILENIHSKISKENNREKIRFINILSRVAAILLIPILIVGGYMFLKIQKSNNLFSSNSSIEVHAPANSRVKCILPDSSMVWISSGSTISYHPNFSENRKIDLKGKAYFDVVHTLDNSPFSVSFKNGKVDVLGTKFAVTSKENGSYSVILVDGKVQATLIKKGKKNKTVVLKPNQMLFVNNDKNILNNVNAKNLVAWKDGELIFRNTPIKYVFTRISDFYDVEIILKDERLQKLTYWGKFKDERLEDVLELISMTLPIEYRIEPRVKQEDNSFSKKKVVIKSKY